jgi:hypothetical protein
VRENFKEIDILTRREIEARIAGPICNALIIEYGKDKTFALLEPVIRNIARESGKELANIIGGNSLTDFEKTMAIWGKDNALHYDILERENDQLAINVNKCRYAEMYTELGLRDVGYLLSCARDFAMIEGFNSKIQLKRTQTIMEGCSYCDFRFILKK